MAGTYKENALITVLLMDIKTSVPTIIQTMNKQNTSDPRLAGIPNDDVAVKAANTLLQKIYTGTKTKLPTYTESQLKSQVKVVVTMQHENAPFIQRIARQQVVLTNDINVGINLVETAGYELKLPKGTIIRKFNLKAIGNGMVDISTVSAGAGASYLRQFAPTTGDGIEPQAKDISEIKVTRENYCVVGDLKVGTWYAFREAIILPVPKKGKTPPIVVPSKEKAVTPKITTSGRKVLFSALDETSYTWSPWQYILVS